MAGRTNLRGEFRADVLKDRNYDLACRRRPAFPSWKDQKVKTKLSSENNEYVGAEMDCSLAKAC